MNSAASSPGNEGPVPGDLQFERAQPIAAPGSASDKGCVACKQPIRSNYYDAQGMVICENCVQRIRTGQQAPPPLSLARAVLYGCGAALAGSILYAAVAMITGLEIGLIAIVVGIMVGKAVRFGSHGLGGRPRQILAVMLTYFAITTSYIPVFIYGQIKHPQRQHRTAAASNSAASSQTQEPRERMSPGKAIAILLLLAAVAPFLSLGSGVSGLISLFIIFIGLQRAWNLTARSEIRITGPYEFQPAQ